MLHEIYYLYTPLFVDMLNTSVMLLSYLMRFNEFPHSNCQYALRIFHRNEHITFANNDFTSSLCLLLL